MSVKVFKEGWVTQNKVVLSILHYLERKKKTSRRWLFHHMLTEHFSENRCYKQLLRKCNGTGTAAWGIFAFLFIVELCYIEPHLAERICTGQAVA